MKKLVLTGVLLSAVTVFAQSNRGTATGDGGAITIDYGQPSAKGRDVMAMIEPGTTWRMGADAATTLTTKKDLTFGGTKVVPGTYTLEAHFVEKEKWNLVVSKGSTKAAEAPGKFEKGQPAVEQLKIDLKSDPSGTTLVLTWGTYKLSVPFKVG